MRLEHTDPLAAFLLRSPLGALVRGVAHLRASVRSKLLGAFLLVTLMFLLMGAFSVQTIRRMSQHTDALDAAHQRVAWSYQLQHSLAMQMHLTGMALLVRDEATLANILRENNRFNDTLARIEQAAPDAERQIIQKIRTGQEEAMTVVADIANLVRDGKVDAALSLQLTREDPLYKTIDEQVGLIVEKENERMVAQRASVEAANRRSLLAMGTLGLASILLALTGGFVISWAFIVPVQRAHAFLSDVAAGHFGGTVRVPNRDEFGALAARLNETSRELARLDAEQKQAARVAALAEPEARAGQPGQVRLPGQHEPRAAHADERHPGLHGDDPRRAVRRDAARHQGAADRHPGQWQAPAASHQRRARPVEDRGRAHGAGPVGVLRPRRRRDRAGLAPLAGHREGARFRDRGR